MVKKIWTYKIIALLFLVCCNRLIAAQEANNDKDKYNDQLLEAARNGQNDTIDDLVKNHGAAINYVNNGGKNALMCAVAHGHNHTIDHLVNKYGLDINYVNKYRLDINYVNNHGRNALHYAEENNHYSTINYLMNKHGMKRNEIDNKILNKYEEDDSKQPELSGNNDENNDDENYIRMPDDEETPYISR